MVCLSLANVQGKPLEAAARGQGRGAIATAALQLAVQILGQPLHVADVLDDAVDALDLAGGQLTVLWWMLVLGCVPIVGRRPLGHIRAGERDGSVHATPSGQKRNQLHAPALSIGSSISSGGTGLRSGGACAPGTRTSGGHPGAQLDGLSPAVLWPQVVQGLPGRRTRRTWRSWRTRTLLSRRNGQRKWRWLRGTLLHGGAVAGAHLTAALRLWWLCGSRFPECVLLRRGHWVVLVQLLQHLLVRPALKNAEFYICTWAFASEKSRGLKPLSLFL